MQHLVGKIKPKNFRIEDNQKILGLDLALTCIGYSVYDTGLKKFIEVDSFNPPDKEHALHERLGYIHQKLTELRNSYNFSLYVLETPFVNFAYKSSTMQVLRVNGVAIFALGDIPFIEIAPTSVKRYVTDSGRAKKELVQEHILRKYKYLEFKNCDESDAVAIVTAGIQL